MGFEVPELFRDWTINHKTVVPGRYVSYTQQATPGINACRPVPQMLLLVTVSVVPQRARFRASQSRAHLVVRLADAPS